MIALGAGIILDILLGDPHGLPHPVRAIGALTAALERRFNREADCEDRKDPAMKHKQQIIRGSLLWLIVVILTAAAVVVVMVVSYRAGKIAGVIVEAILTYYVLAAKSLRDESMKVYSCLTDADTDINETRAALSMIVGRDTAALDEAGIERAAVETVAENTSDGVIAPLIYTAIGGPVAGFIYKAINTMDSMIGYHNERYEYFGRFAARADDVANFLPSRISAVFMIAAASICELFDKEKIYNHTRAFCIWRRDRRAHKSPNSAQTESVCAGSLGLRLAGDASYGGVIVRKPYIGDETRSVEAEDIKRAIRLMFVTEAVCTAAIYIIILLILIFP